MRLLLALALLTSLLALALLPVPAAATAPTGVDATPRIAVISAFEPEWQGLQAALTGRRDQQSLAGVTFVTGRLAGKDVLLFLSGVSMVNAAMTTQLAIDHFTLTRILVSGIAGGVDPGLAIGDVVVAGQWSQYLEAAFARDTPQGWRIPPFLGPPPFANYGMIFPQNLRVARAGDDGQPEQRFWFPVDPQMLEVAGRVAAGLKLEACVAANRCLAQPPRIVVGGNGVSGPAFVDNAAFRGYVFATFQARVLDMETAAVAHVAFANRVPFIAFRSLSDLAGGGPGENELATFFQLAADNAAAVVRAFLQALP